MEPFQKSQALNVEALSFSAHLRDYQKDCIRVSLRKWQEGVKRQIVSLPVASGKTVSGLICSGRWRRPKLDNIILLLF